MNLLNSLFSWYGKRTVVIIAVAVAVLLVAGLFIRQSTSPKEETLNNTDFPLVEIQSINMLGSESTYSIVGTVRAVSEARLQTEASGRITSVNVELGDTVRQGAVIATIENSAQRAALLQAEGSYESALASAATSESSTETAETTLEAALASAVSTYKSAFISADSAVRNTIDDLFTNPTAQVPGFRLDGFGSAPAFNAERLSLEPMLDQWALEVDTVSAANVRTRIDQAQASIERISQFTQTLASIVARQNVSSSFTQAEKDALESEFLGIRSTLNQTMQALNAAETAITNAEESLSRAKIAASGQTVSLAGAQIKSALGSLRAAQAAYEKTIVRTPISGVVNALYLKSGDYTGPSAQAAVIANNNALEITAYVNQAESNRLSVGQQVRIEETIAGTITNISPAIDPGTGKVELKIQADNDGLKNGDTVSVSISQEETTQTIETASEIIIPITALKVETDRIVVFTVSNESKLVAHEIVEGPLMGSNIVITQGISRDMEIVVDARGLNEGDQVEVASK